MSHSISERSVCHVVRRYGCVGGMESYVWHLSHAQLELGYRVSILSESVYGDPDSRITVNRVTPRRKTRRWAQMLAFREAVNQYLVINSLANGEVLHSHERCLDHHVSTFHGPPMNATGWMKLFSRRVRAWEEMEVIEINGRQRPLIVPVSAMLREQLGRKYPEALVRLARPIYPGISGFESGSRVPMDSRSQPRLVFVGVDWKRKGLPLALRIFQKLRQRQSEVTLTVFGAPDSVRGAVERAGAQWIGWSPSINFKDFDILVHPAKHEPYGMVVSEARAAGCKVVCSDVTGAVELHVGDAGLIAVPLGAELNDWVDSVCALFDQPLDEFQISRDWGQVAEDYEKKVYQKIRVGYGVSTASGERS